MHGDMMNTCPATLSTRPDAPYQQDLPYKIVAALAAVLLLLSVF